MKWATLSVFAGCAGLLLFVAGCGGGRVAPTVEGTANEKVKALKNLADEMAKEPDGLGAKGALEQFRTMQLDPAKSPQQAQELADVYRQKIQGKYKGTVASELQNEMAQYLGKK